jgi:alpha-beta hydrolase superfamily lysophospholipase
MSEERFGFTSKADGAAISALKWKPDAKIKGVVQIAHGVAEHAARYARLAAALNAAGYAAYANDHRGHGQSIPSGAEPGAFGEAGWEGLVSDIAQLGELARDECAGAPLVLLGHSMGSFAAQTFLLDHSPDIDACVLSGSSDMPTLAQFAASGAEMSLASFNAAFEPARTPFDWLSRDAVEVDKYVADPLCGFEAPPETAMAMLGAAARMGDAAAVSNVRNDLPLYVFSGRSDPLCGGGMMLETLTRRFMDAGVADVTLKIYEDGRHEMLNETNRHEVTGDLIAWIDRVAG